MKENKRYSAYFVLTIFFVSLIMLTFDRLSDLFLLWMPEIDILKRTLGEELPNEYVSLYRLFIAVFFLSGTLLLFFFKERIIQAIFLTLLVYGALELTLVDPFWLIFMYTLFVVTAILIHVSIEDEQFGAFFQPVKVFLIKGGWRLVPLPLLASLFVLSSFYETGPPPELRVIHPAPPEEIMVHGESFNLQELENPYRTHKKEDPKAYEKSVREGGDIYFKNCFFCHGGKLDGKGHFAKGLNPKPADFTDPGTIAQLRESFVFWRIAKGGPGLPPQSAPWNSAMPPWEKSLTKEETWKVVLFIYEATGQEPKKF